MSDSTDTARYLTRMRIATPEKVFALGAPGPEPATRPPSLASEARRWSYVLRSRERWPAGAEVALQQQQDAAATLRGFGLDDAALRAIAAAGQAVVQMPYEAEHIGWDGRTFPWEFVLARATKPYRSEGRQLTVMRELQIDAAAQIRAQRWPRHFEPTALAAQAPAPRVLFVHSYPGALAQAYEVQGEQDRVRAAFGLAAEDAARWQVLDTPTLAQLRERCAAFRPEIVHFSGCDNHGGLLRYREAAGPDALVAMDGRVQTVNDWLNGDTVVLDGCLLKGEGGLPQMTVPQPLGDALVAGGHAPFFVGLNLWNSAARIAPMLLPAGVLASMGFQDSFESSLAEYFFDNLYARLRQTHWHLPEAFVQSWAEMRRQADLMPGTGIALWARAPLLPAPGKAAAPPPLPAAAVDITPKERPSAPVELLFKEKTEINYAELHNHQPLFERFELVRLQPDAQPRLRIEVELHCGPERARYDSELVLREPRLNLLKRIRLPLTAALMRTASEALRSALYVKVSVLDGPTLLADTFPLRLLPVDQWRDNQKSGRWLPSFVLPRDPAVQRVITAAQRYVRVIRDDPNAGFEGYQAAAAGTLQPDDESLDQVDLQVEALWAALLHEWQLGYINPPPGYSAKLDSQRLRTPSTIEQARMGTCIDLALLFAACLELVDIYPVIFLLEGHALPGYWRHSGFQTEFRAALPMAREATSDEPTDAAPTVREQREPWWSADHATVWKLIRERRLAPLETVRLTEHCGFREARQAGIDALRSARDFDSALDIVIAREHLITPLPILGGRE
ncbi:hypothetical protein [Aquabacterium sp.]|uniref:hypothetical protein n=1 Tax=Aquabacterium sp. TaxID=1872578 RepID=UPI0037835F2D